MSSLLRNLIFTTMKRVYIAIIGMFACMCAFAGGKCYTIVTKGSEVVVVNVIGECQDTLFLSELSSDIYGDGYKRQSANDSAFLKNIGFLKGSRFYNDKGNVFSFGIGRDCDKVGIELSVIHGDTTLYYFTNGSRNSHQKVRLEINKISDEGESMEEQEKQEDVVQPEEQNEELVQENQQEYTEQDAQSCQNDVVKKEHKTNVWLICICVLFILVIALVGLYVKSLIDINHLREQLGDSADNQRRISDNTSVLSSALNALKTKVPTESDIEKVVLTVLAKQRGANQPIGENKSVASKDVTQQSMQEQIRLLDTDQVECNWNNDYFTLQSNEKPIFRIYQKENTYYYTLVEEIKSALPSMLSGTERFISVASMTNNIAKGVEVVRDGIVIAEGNGRFRVDPNSKLTINVI